jgi:hypothetical protein
MSKRSAVVVVAVGVVAVGLVIFEPWAFFTNDTVNEAAPTASAPTSSAEPDIGPTELASGTFVGQEHDTSGTATVIELPDGSRTLRLEGFWTTNGPDLHVWMSEKKAGGNWFKYGSARLSSASSRPIVGTTLRDPGRRGARRAAQRRHLVQAVPHRLRIGPAGVIVA